MYEFITIGGGEYFVDMFTGVASIVKSGDYINIVKIAGALAFFVAMLNAALNNSLYDAGKWFITTFLIMQVLLYPKTTLKVTDKTNAALQGAAINNVPFVIAYTASTSSQIGYSLTTLFEAVFSLPDDLQYSENGMLFGLNLFKAMSQARINNAKLATSINSFSKNCIFLDVELKIYDFDNLKKSDDIWTFIKSKQVENRFFTYVSSDGSTSYLTCKEGYTKLDADFKNELKNPANIAFYAKKPNLTSALLKSASVDVNKYFLNVSKTAEQSLQQAMMINAIDDATQNYEAQNQIELYQNARAQIQARTTYQAIGSQAGIWIPILKIVIESVFIAAFPLVILLSFIPNFTGTVLRGYFGTFFWLAAWGPIYAILHRISMGHAKTYTIDFGGFTLYSQPGIESAMNDISAMAGYMSIFVPMLALGIARGGAAAMSSMTTAFMSGMQGAATTAAHETTTGNMSFGNVGIGSRQISSGVSIMNEAGQVGRYHDNGSFSIDNSAVESRFGGFDLRGSQRVESMLSNAISQEQALAQTKATQAQTMETQGFEKAISNHRSIESSSGFEQNATAQEKDAFSRVGSAVEEFAKQHNITNEKSANIFAGISGGGSLGIIGVNAGGQVSLGEHDQKLYQEAQRYSDNKNLSHDFEVMRSSMQSNRFNMTDSQGQSINENFSQASNLSRESGVHYENAQRLSEQQQYIKTNSLDFDQSYNNEFVQHLRDKYGSTQSVFEITNPNNLNHSLRDKEIEEFNSYKEKSIMKSVSGGGISSGYESSSRSLSQQNLSQSYKFDSKTTEIDNSNLQLKVDNKIDEVQDKIGQKTLNKSAIESVKKKQDDSIF